MSSNNFLCKKVTIYSMVMIFLIFGSYYIFGLQLKSFVSQFATNHLPTFSHNLNEVEEKILNSFNDLKSNIQSQVNEIIKHQESEPQSCETILLKLVANGRRRLTDDGDVFGLTPSCLKMLTDVDYNITRSYGDTSVEDMRQPHCFKRALTETEKRTIFRSYIVAFKNLLDGAGIDFFLDYGSLIGSLRHHGITPWDDDIDILIEERERPRLIELLKKKQLQSNSKIWEFSITAQSDKHIKFRVQQPYFAHTENKRFRFCFDMFFFRRNLEYRNVSMKTLSGSLLHFNETVIFPTVLRPFEGIWLNVPRNHRLFLSVRYDGGWGTKDLSDTELIPVLQQCTYFTWSNEESRKACKQNDRPCSSLMPYFPFVKRIPLRRSSIDGSRSGILELLVQGDQVFKAAYIPLHEEIPF